MTIENAVAAERLELLVTAQTAILAGMHIAWDRARQQGGEPKENDIIAAIVLKTIPFIAKAWSKILIRHQISLSASSVYCHHRPQVSFTGLTVKKSVELGDILFVNRHKHSNGEFSRRALLCQAKSSNIEPHKISKDEIDQLTLYTRWPEFRYVNSSMLNGRVRDVQPKSIHHGACYIHVDNRPPEDLRSGLLGLPGTFPIGVCRPDVTLKSQYDLAYGLVLMLVGLTGREFESKTSCSRSNGWSNVVWDLLGYGYQKTFSAKGAGVKRGGRTSGDSLIADDGECYSFLSTSPSETIATEALGDVALAEVFFSGDSGNFRNRYSDISREDGGVSVVVIETSSATTDRPVRD